MSSQLHVTRLLCSNVCLSSKTFHHFVINTVKLFQFVMLVDFYLFWCNIKLLCFSMSLVIYFVIFVAICQSLLRCEHTLSNAPAEAEALLGAARCFLKAEQCDQDLNCVSFLEHLTASINCYCHAIRVCLLYLRFCYCYLFNVIYFQLIYIVNCPTIIELEYLLPVLYFCVI